MVHMNIFASRHYVRWISGDIHGANFVVTKRKPPVSPVTTRLASWRFTIFSVTAMLPAPLQSLSTYTWYRLQSYPPWHEFRQHIWSRAQFIYHSCTLIWLFEATAHSIEKMETSQSHDDVIKWKHFPRNWPFVRGIHRSRWIPHTKASDAELWCFLWSASE